MITNKRTAKIYPALLKYLLLGTAVIVFKFPVIAQNVPCKFDPASLQFVGTPIEQARCLLRHVKPGGILDGELEKLPNPLEKLVGREVKIKKDRLRTYLKKNNIDESTIGGSIDGPLIMVRLPNGGEIQTLYF